MRKSINKLVAVAIGISIMSGSAIPVFAAGTTTANTSTSTGVQVKSKPVLTLDNAIKAAISNSSKLALKSKEIKLYEDKLDIQDEIKDIQDSDNDFPYDQLELLIKQKEAQKDFMEDQIAQDITNKYNDLVAKGKELNKLKMEVEIRTKEFKDTELRKKLGMKTSIELKNAEIEIQTLKNSIGTKEAQLKNSQDYFKVLTNGDLTKCTLEQDPKYEVFKINGSVDEYFDKVIDKYLKYDNKLIALSQDNLKDSKEDKPGNAPQKSKYYDTDEDGNKTFDEAGYAEDVKGYLSDWTTYGQYLESKYNVSSGKVTMEESKKSLKDGLKESYTSLLDLENKINVLKSSISVDNKQLSIAKLKYDMGLMTKTEYDKQVLNLGKEDLEVTLRTNIDNYNKLKNSIRKPWILSSSGGM